MKPNILVAIPTWRGDMNARLCLALLELKNGQATFSFTIYENTLISKARNILASGFLTNPALTHLLFVDNDMIFRPEAIWRMIEADVPLIGLAYPQRKLDLERAMHLSKTEPPQKAIAKSMRFNIGAPPSGQWKGSKGICEVGPIGMGATLISREALQAIIASGVRTFTKHNQGDLSGPLYGFFDHDINGEEEVSEDIAFCRRAMKAGIKIHAVIDEEVGHVGPFVYKARLSDALT